MDIAEVKQILGVPDMSKLPTVESVTGSFTEAKKDTDDTTDNVVYEVKQPNGTIYYSEKDYKDNVKNLESQIGTDAGVKKDEYGMVSAGWLKIFNSAKKGKTIGGKFIEDK